MDKGGEVGARAGVTCNWPSSNSIPEYMSLLQLGRRSSLWPGAPPEAVVSQKARKGRGRQSPMSPPRVKTAPSGSGIVENDSQPFTSLCLGFCACLMEANCTAVKGLSSAVQEPESKSQLGQMSPCSVGTTNSVLSSVSSSVTWG